MAISQIKTEDGSDIDQVSETQVLPQISRVEETIEISSNVIAVDFQANPMRQPRHRPWILPPEHDIL